jgi:hypothetical protein
MKEWVPALRRSARALHRVRDTSGPAEKAKPRPIIGNGRLRLDRHIEGEIA